MLINEAGAVVDLIVHHDEEVLLGSVLRDVGIGVLLHSGGHCIESTSVTSVRVSGRGFELRQAGWCAIEDGDGTRSLERRNVRF